VSGLSIRGLPVTCQYLCLSIITMIIFSSTSLFHASLTIQKYFAGSTIVSRSSIFSAPPPRYLHSRLRFTALPTLSVFSGHIAIHKRHNLPYKQPAFTKKVSRTPNSFSSMFSSFYDETHTTFAVFTRVPTYLEPKPGHMRV